MRIHVDKNTCVSSGQCALTAPDVFDQDEDTGVAWLLTDHPSPEQEKGVRDAASMCPVMAITLTED